MEFRMKASVGVFVSVVALLLAVNPVAAQDIPRLADGHPDMSGIWQVLNEANYDLEPHMARHSLQMREGPVNPVPAIPTLRMGAVGAVPGSLGVIVGGGKIPYTAEARALKEENMAEWIDRSPEVKCYMPGVPRATYMPMPFRARQTSSSLISLPGRFATSIWTIRDPRRSTLGWDGRSGTGKVTRWLSM
jgi:hypothetical protein